MTSTALAGIFRSLRIYRRDAARHVAMDRLYGRYLRTGDLAFDIGAHVGDRIASFRRLGARVVAVEPQPLCQRALRLMHGGDRLVTLVPAAVGEKVGRIRLHVNRANPTVSTSMPDFITAAAGAIGWEGQVLGREHRGSCRALPRQATLSRSSQKCLRLNATMMSISGTKRHLAGVWSALDGAAVWRERSNER